VKTRLSAPRYPGDRNMEELPRPGERQDHAARPRGWEKAGRRRHTTLEGGVRVTRLWINLWHHKNDSRPSASRRMSTRAGAVPQHGSRACPSTNLVLRLLDADHARSSSTRSSTATSIPHQQSEDGGAGGTRRELRRHGRGGLASGMAAHSSPSSRSWNRRRAVSSTHLYAGRSPVHLHALQDGVKVTFVDPKTSMLGSGTSRPKRGPSMGRRSATHRDILDIEKLAGLAAPTASALHRQTMATPGLRPLSSGPPWSPTPPPSSSAATATPSAASSWIPASSIIRVFPASPSPRPCTTTCGSGIPSATIAS
jgi:hypothetical protein